MSNDTMIRPANPSAAECQCGYTDQADEGVEITGHDALLAIEDGGVRDITDLFAAYDYAINSVGVECGVPWYAMEDFVARHNWRDPVTMCRLAEHVALAFRPRSAALRDVEAASA